MRTFAIGVLAIIQTHLSYADPLKAQRPFEVGDIFMQEDIGRAYGGPTTLSNTENELAFTRVRVPGTSDGPQLDNLAENARGDVWVQLEPGEPAFNLTHGDRDNSSWWAPQWNHDGHLLAMLSTRGGGVGIWIWDVTTRQLRRLSLSNIDVDHAWGITDRPFAWLDSAHVLYPASTSHGLDNETSATRPLKSSRSELESGIPVDLAERNNGELLLVDVRTGMETSLARGRTRLWQTSPDGKNIAFVREASIQAPMASELLSDFDHSAWAVGIASANGKPIPLGNPACQFADNASLRWSPDGSELAFLGYTQSKENTVVLCRVNVGTHAVRSLPLSGMDTSTLARQTQPTIEWTDSRELILSAPKPNALGLAAWRVRQELWVVSKAGVVRCLTEGTPAPPKHLWARDDRRAFVGIADGHLWRIAPSKGPMDDLTAKSNLTIDEIEWPVHLGNGMQQESLPGATYREIVVSARDNQGLALYLVNLHTGSFRLIRTPTPAADLLAYSPMGGTGIFYQSDKNGLSMWRTRLPEGPVHELFKSNEFLRDIEEAQSRLVEYTSLNGKRLTASLILPIGYRAGNRYPLITWVYPEYCPDSDRDIRNGVGTRSSFNLQIPAARGYAILIPCMPLEPYGVADEPMLRLLDGVMPAVDKSIELGIADPDRLFLMGHSFGGFATYGIITQTQRFKAAVAISGPSDLISLYGTFAARDRETDHPQENIFAQVLMESGQTRMGNPPWKDLGRYLRNSPIFYVERVHTPVLIIQGSLDFVGIEQGEEFFTALYRQGKRAEFVRYWGEGHSVQSQQNVNDMWQRIFSWFEGNATSAAARVDQ